MREIISIQVGNGGTKTGQKFWEIISEEHGISQSGVHNGYKQEQIEKTNVYFKETRQGRYKPRSIFTDLCPASLEYLQIGQMSQFFEINNMIEGNYSSQNCFARGFYTEGSEVIEQVMDSIRRETEYTDSLQGFQLSHTMLGGTGSGFSSLIMQNLKDEFPDRILQTFSQADINKSDVIVGPYNTCLTLGYLIELADMTIYMDQHKLFDTYYQQKKIVKQIPFNEINDQIGNTQSGLTSCYRFPGQLNSDLRKTCFSMVPYSKLKFLTPGISPFDFDIQNKTKKYSVQNVTETLWNDQNILCDINLQKGRYLQLQTFYRGVISSNEVIQQLKQITNKQSTKFVDWLPNDIQYSISNIPCKQSKVSATQLGNTTAIQQTIGNQLDMFDKMFNRKAFTKFYLSEGMDEMEFFESQNLIKELISEYQVIQDQDQQQDE